MLLLTNTLSKQTNKQKRNCLDKRWKCCGALFFVVFFWFLLPALGLLSKLVNLVTHHLKYGHWIVIKTKSAKDSCLMMWHYYLWKAHRITHFKKTERNTSSALRNSETDQTGKQWWMVPIKHMKKSLMLLSLCLSSVQAKDERWGKNFKGGAPRNRIMQDRQSVKAGICMRGGKEKESGWGKKTSESWNLAGLVDKEVSSWISGWMT